MLKRFAVALAALLSLVAIPALAQDNLASKEATGTAFKYRASCTGSGASRVCVVMNGLAGPDGTPYTASSGAPVAAPSLGAPTDTAWNGSDTSASVVSLLKALPRAGQGIRMQDGTGNALTSRAVSSSRPLEVVILDGTGAQITSFGGSGGGGSVTVSNFPSTQPVTGTFWQATQPVSLAALPALAAGSNAIGNVGVTSLPALPNGSNTIGNVGVTGTLPLPTGAATAAKQPALGTAGASATDVLSVQGIASGTPLPVSIASLPSHPVTNAGTFAVQVSTSALPTGAATETTLASLLSAVNGPVPAGTSVIGKVGIDQTTPGTTNGVSVTNFPATQPVSATALPLPTGAATSAAQGTLLTALGTPMQQTGGSVALVGATTGGNSVFNLVAAATNNATSVKGSAGQVYGIQVYNNSASVAYLKFYDKATAPTCGTDTPKEVHMIPASTSGAGAVVPSDIGVTYTLGIGICIVGGIANNDNTSVAATSIIANVRYR
jgi:hypothetical protein